GVPGSITTGVRKGPTTPKPCGLPGVNGHRAEAGCAQALQGCLDAVALAAHADPAAGDDQISIGGGLVNRSERTLADRERVQGPDHPDTITARGNLASACHSARKLAMALPLYERTLADCERVLGPDHQD